MVVLSQNDMATKKKEPEVQLHLRIPKSHGERLDVQANKRDLSVAQLVRAAIAEKLERLENPPVTLPAGLKTTADY